MNQNFYIKNNDVFKPTKQDSIDIRNSLPAGNYTVGCDPRTGEYYLQTTPGFKKLKKYYGDVSSKSDRIVNTFKSRDKNTGVLLAGEKGSGKTLLAKHVSASLAEEGVPTILVEEAYCDSGFIAFMNAIDQPVMIFIDEFEKIFRKEEVQNALLSLLDGTATAKKLFVLTCNEYSYITNYMKNRPGRIYYSLKYEGIENKFIREFCEDQLVNKQHTDTFVRLSQLFKMNFDMLQAWVEEVNRYNETPQEALQYLNINQTDSSGYYNFTITSPEGEIVGGSDLKGWSKWYGNPSSFHGVSMYNYNFKEEDCDEDEEDCDETYDLNKVSWDDYDEQAYEEVTPYSDSDGNLEFYQFLPSHLKSLGQDGTFKFQNHLGYILEVWETAQKKFDIRAL